MRKLMAVIAAAGIVLIGTSAHAATAPKTYLGTYSICLANAPETECLNNPGAGNQYHLTPYADSSNFDVYSNGTYLMFQTLNIHCVYLDQAHAQVDENSYACQTSNLIDNWGFGQEGAADDLISAKNSSAMHTASADTGAAVWSSAPASGDWLAWDFCNDTGCVSFCHCQHRPETSSGAAKLTAKPASVRGHRLAAVGWRRTASR